MAIYEATIKPKAAWVRSGDRPGVGVRLIENIIAIKSCRWLRCMKPINYNSLSAALPSDDEFIDSAEILLMLQSKCCRFLELALFSLLNLEWRAMKILHVDEIFNDEFPLTKRNQSAIRESQNLHDTAKYFMKQSPRILEEISFV